MTPSSSVPTPGQAQSPKRRAFTAEVAEIAEKSECFFLCWISYSPSELLILNLTVCL
jgi:hypothetical protein